MVPKRIAICKVMILSMFFLLPGGVQASDPFAGITLEPAAKTYLVIKDINVRAGPKTKSARVGRLRKRELIGLQLKRTVRILALSMEQPWCR